ncbi:PREDICTED: uncharacterized protein LOC108545908 [Eufriesea mexicana]|uniref:uncharacterized protein LOC108545908 n=1 Tax=Eufriesea mexicana TaxID=516756 RepID=UPI00083C6933|nr:PREDICTED: uncharacterized protein LOC108545908 [Eufriesea mexicana]
MEGHSYVSCIKINGVPILPPMVTKDIKQEISNYKESAINVEKKLAVSRTIGKVKIELKDIKCKKKVHDSKENLINFEYENGNYNETKIKTNVDVNDIPIRTSKSFYENLEKTLQCSKKLNMRCKSENQINLAPDLISRSESIIADIDTDYCSNETIPIKSATTETIPEIWKPQVPKTLNIIPLTLNNVPCKGIKKCQESDLDNLGDTPKLVRQGSYILDTPSPILLAHMQMELASSTCAPCSEYIPTSCANTNQRKEWNVTQAKIEWEYEAKNKKSIPTRSYSNTGHAMCKSISLQTKPECSFTMYPSTKSVDCIQTMLTDKHIDGSNTQIDHKKNHSIYNNDENRRRLETWNEYNSSCTFNPAYKFGGSLEDLNKHNNKSTTDKLTAKLSKNLDIQDPISRLKSNIASDKLLTVYKKVQEMHKKQMAELMFRQHREQTLLQKEFEKQQLLLLAEIKKSFPEISVSLFPENILSPSFNQITTDSDNLCENNNNNMQSVNRIKHNSEQGDEIKHLQDDNIKMVPCPLNYIYSEVNYDNSSCSSKYSYTVQSSETSSNVNNSITEIREGDMEIQTNDTKNYKKKLLEESDKCKRPNVSRELFPLDSKTIHVPILDSTIYETKHIKAANVINAYVRGYLVRRIMRTERVIALKNTYKEALHYILKLHIDAPLNRSEFNFLHRLQLQCDAASMNVVELFAQNPQKRMQIIAQDREIKQSRIERPTSARSYSFATQRTLARKKLKEMEDYQPTSFVRSCLSRSRCQTWTSDIKERLISSNILYQSIKRSTSAGTVRRPWR